MLTPRTTAANSFRLESDIWCDRCCAGRWRCTRLRACQRSGERLSGQSMTGLDSRDTAAVLLAEARSVNFVDPVRAADLYALVLVEDPANVEALTYRGWTLALAARQNPDDVEGAAQFSEGVDLLVEAVQVDPTYADPLAFGNHPVSLRRRCRCSKTVCRCVSCGEPAGGSERSRSESC